MSFKKAERFLTNPTIAITGPTGSGKTFSALRLAAGIAKQMNARFALIDAENGSASLYSEFFDFDTLNISPPFTTEKYIDAINLAEKGGYCALVIDSITHAWAGEGGLLEQKAQLDSRPGSNHWTNWNPIKAKDLKFKSCYLHSSIPFLIATMRSKMEYQQTEDGGKKKVQKVGMAPVQSDGIEYEFSVVLDIAMNHEAEVSKDRTHLFDKTPIFQITESTGEILVKWRTSGKDKPAVVPPPAPVETKPSDGELGAVSDGWPEAASRAIAGEYTIMFGKNAGKKISSIEKNSLVDYCNWVVSSAKEQQKPISPDGVVGVFLTNASIFLGMTW